jgi:hypothetical protein
MLWPRRGILLRPSGKAEGFLTGRLRRPSSENPAGAVALWAQRPSRLSPTSSPDRGRAFSEPEGRRRIRRSIVNGAHRFSALLPKKLGATSSAANQAGGTEEGAPERSEAAGRSSLAVEPQRSKPKTFYRQSTTTHMKARRIYKASQLLGDGSRVGSAADTST